MTSRPGPLTADEQTRIRELHAAGSSRNDIARALDRGGRTISRWCAAQEPPLTFDRTQIAAATEARKVDLAAQRARLLQNQQDLLELDQDTLLAVRRGKEKWTSILRDSDGAETVRTLTFIPALDWQRHMNATSAATTAIGKLHSIDSGRRDEATTSLLSELGDALGINDQTQAPE